MLNLVLNSGKCHENVFISIIVSINLLIYLKYKLLFLFLRVLCALVNSFVPETFTTEVLLNDR